MEGKYKSRVTVDGECYYCEAIPGAVESNIIDGGILVVSEFYGPNQRRVYINTALCKLIKVEPY